MIYKLIKNTGKEPVFLTFDIIRRRNVKEEIIIASGNKGKIKEVQEILNDYNIISMKDYDLQIEVEEDQETFEGNAIKKAKTIAKILEGRKCIADDSGIEIEYLNGFPGLETKRWLDGTDRERNLQILKKLEGVPKEKRNIKFVSAIAISDGKNTVSAVAELEGKVANQARGKNGFGFDEIFELEDARTLAELSKEEKNRISARRKALEILKEKLVN